MSKPNKKPKPQIITAPKGMHDILPPDQPLWEKVKKIGKETADFYNFLKIETPILEKEELFVRPLGATSEVVEKQMFTLKTKGGDSLVLRPEGTASIARSYIENGLSHLGQPLKVYYEGPMFRYENPQAGRFRQFHHFGFEIISNDNDPIYDAQVILTTYRFLQGLKLKEMDLQLNSTGCNKCRPNYKRKLVEYYKNHEKNLCADDKRRLKENPMRLLDCKEEKCNAVKKDAPNILDSLCSDCRKHFKKVLEYLEEVKIPYSMNNHLVRGFDYYTKTVFEIFYPGFNSAIAGGGRYDYLLETLGKQAPGVGGAIGMERIIDIIKQKEINLFGKTKPRLHLIHIGDLAKTKSLAIVEMFREAGMDLVEALGKESLRAQLKSADKIESPYALIFGQQEAFEQSIIIRDMKSGAQETVPLTKIVEVMKRKMK